MSLYGSGGWIGIYFLQNYISGVEPSRDYDGKFSHNTENLRKRTYTVQYMQNCFDEAQQKLQKISWTNVLWHSVIIMEQMSP